MSALGFLSTILPRFDDALQKLAWKTAAILSTGMGLGGNDVFSDGAFHAGDWWCIHAWEDCTIVRLDFKPGSSSGSLVGKTLKAGDREYGMIVGIQATGTLVAYRASVGSPS